MSSLGREDWEKIDRLFSDALAQPAEKREAFLASSDVPADIVARVRRLLKAGIQAEARIGESAQALAAEVMEGWEEAPAEEFPTGSGIGPYRVVREIGRGGMGTVYLAERADEQYDREVAVKVVKRGMDTHEVLQRFRREGRILARLEHPGIGRMYDAGATADGRPYLVLEYIEGEPIDDFCDRHRLSLEERIHIFLKVCEAVSFAHQKLVLHRDLKPSNILVSDDGPRLLDFGIGKVLDEDGLESQHLTQFAGRRLTPEYASPEQLAGEAISTASDVYALGVVLYELLTGLRPDRSKLRRPSTTFTEPDAEVETGAFATARRSTPRRLVKRLQGDLDVVLMRALHEEPGRRYPSVEAFSEDLRRHLNGFPVTARPDSVRYRIGKFVQRNRWPVASGSGLGAAILIFSITSVLQQAQTARERDRAERERVKAEQVAGVLEDFFTGSGLASRERIDTLTVRAFLDERADQVLSELGDQPAVQGVLLRILGTAQRDFGSVEEADSLLSRSVAVLESDPSTDPHALLRAKSELAHLRSQQGRWEEARTLHDAWFDPGVELTADERAAAHHNVALALLNVGQFDSAGMMLDTSLAIHRAHPDLDRAGYASSLSMRGGIAQRMADLPLAVALSKQAWEVIVREMGADHPAVFPYEQNYAFMIYRSGSPAEAEPMYASMVERYRDQIGETPNYGTLLQNYGSVLRGLGKLPEALLHVRRAVELEQRLLGPDNPQRTFGLDALGTTLEALERYDEAKLVFEEQLSLSESGFGPQHPSTAVSMSKVASLACRAVNLDADASRERFEDAEEAIGRSFPPDHPAVTDLLLRKGRCYLRLGHTDEARAALEMALGRLETQGPSAAKAIESARELLARAKGESR